MCMQFDIIKQFYIALHTSRAYTLCKAYEIHSPWKYFPTLNTYTTLSQDGTIQERCDSTVSHKSKCVIYVTVYRMYERLETAVIIWCIVLDIKLDGLCLVMHERSYVLN